MTAAIEAFMNRCQTLVGRVCDTDREAQFAEVRHVVTDLPLSMPKGEQLVISAVLTQVLARLVQLAGIGGRPQVAAGFVKLAEAGSDFGEWRHALLRIARIGRTEEPSRGDSIRGSPPRPQSAPRTTFLAVSASSAVDALTCHTVLKPGDPAGASDPRVKRMLRVIHRRFADPTLHGQIITNAANVSYWYGTRLLKRRTGIGVVAHLHRHRVGAARRLVLETRLSMKEIAYAVGYVHQSELARHFSARYGMSPRKYRQMLAARRWLGPVRE